MVNLSLSLIVSVRRVIPLSSLSQLFGCPRLSVPKGNEEGNSWKREREENCRTDCQLVSPSPSLLKRSDGRMSMGLSNHTLRLVLFRLYRMGGVLRERGREEGKGRFRFVPLLFLSSPFSPSHSGSYWVIQS